MVASSIASLFIKHKLLKPFSLRDNFRAIYKIDHAKNDEANINGAKVTYLGVSIPIHLTGSYRYIIKISIA